MLMLHPTTLCAKAGTALRRQNTARWETKYKACVLLAHIHKHSGGGGGEMEGNIPCTQTWYVCFHA